VWRTELGTTLIVGFNSTTVLSAYLRNLCSQEYETAAPLASIATAPPLASIATALPLALKFLPCMAPQKRALCLSADKVGFLLRLWSAVSVPARVVRDGQMPAGIALFDVLHMAAEGGGAAVANRFEGASLLGTDYVSPLFEEVFLVSAEDTGHFGPTFAHRIGGMSLVARIRSMEPSISSGLF